MQGNISVAQCNLRSLIFIRASYHFLFFIDSIRYKTTKPIEVYVSLLPCAKNQDTDSDEDDGELNNCGLLCFVTHLCHKNMYATNINQIYKALLSASISLRLGKFKWHV